MSDSDSSYEECRASAKLIKSNTAISSSSAAYTVHDAIEMIGFGRFQIIMSLIAGFSTIADSMEIMLLSLLTPSLVCEWGITPAQQALCTTCVFIGWMVGSPVWGWLCDRYGRRTGLFFSALMCSIFGIATAASTSFPMFVVLRGCVGLGLGGITQVNTIFTEFLPTANRATCLLMLSVFWAIGSANEAVIALLVMPTLGWRGLVVCSSVPLLIFAFCCSWLPESARYFVAHGNMDEAKRVLERVARYNNRSLPDGHLVSERRKNHDEDDEYILLLQQDSEHEDLLEWKDTNKTTGMLALIEKPFLVTTLLLWVVWMMNAFSYYGMTLYTTMLFQSTDVCHGGSKDNVNGNNTSLCVPLKQEDYNDIITTSFSELPGLALSFLMIERVGRKFTISVQFFLFGIANYLLYFCMKRSVLVAILFAARAFISSAFQTTYVYTPEVYPTHMRAIGIGTASAFGRIGAMVTPYVAQVIATSNPVYATLIYGTSGLVGALAAFLLPIETAGRQIKD